MEFDVVTPVLVHHQPEFAVFCRWLNSPLWLRSALCVCACGGSERAGRERCEGRLWTLSWSSAHNNCHVLTWGLFMCTFTEVRLKHYTYTSTWHFINHELSWIVVLLIVWTRHLTLTHVLKPFSQWNPLHLQGLKLRVHHGLSVKASLKLSPCWERS